MQTKFITVNKPQQIVLDYSEIGNGKPIIFLHGGGVNHYAYKRFLEKLGKYYKIYAFTYPGFKQSGSMKKYSIENFVELIDDFSNKLNLSEFILMGQSMGAGLALAYAASYPQKVIKTVVFTPLMSPLNQNMFKTFYYLRKNEMEAKSKLKDKFGGASFVELAKTYTRKIIPLVKLQRFASKFDVTNLLPNIKSKVLMFIGTIDIVTYSKIQKQNAKLITNCKLIEYEDVGHYLLWAKTEETIKEVRKFLD